MKYLHLFAVLILFSGHAGASSVREDIEKALNTVYGLKMMQEGEEYTLRVGTRSVKGRRDDFLRIRSPEEILSSGLSSGCGDYAYAFYWLVSKKGREALFLDSVELSVSSLLNRFNGHTGVTVKDPETGKWLLVDPTAGEVLSEDWDLSSKIYRSGGGTFYIGYLGKLENYPYHNPAALRSFYDKTLNGVPAGVLDEEIVRLDFSVSTSPVPSGYFLNRHAPEFIKYYADIYERLGVHPKKYVKIKFLPGSSGPETSCVKTGDGELSCHVGGSSDMSGSLFFWLEGKATEYLKENKPLVYAQGENTGTESGKESSVVLLPKPFSVEFIEDKSMKKEDGSWKNEFYPDFRMRYGSQKGFPVHVYSNGSNVISYCKWKGKELRCFFGDRSGLGDSVYKLVEKAIIRGK